MIEIACAQDIVALFILALHVIKHHLQLGISLRGICPVSRQMGIKDYKLFSVFHRNPGIIVAAVQIEEFLKARRNGKTSSQRGL